MKRKLYRVNDRLRKRWKRSLPEVFNGIEAFADNFDNNGDVNLAAEQIDDSSPLNSNDSDLPIYEATIGRVARDQEFTTTITTTTTTTTEMT